MRCNLCRGLQNLFVCQNGRRAWFTCPFCEGIGDVTPIGPATISISKAQQKQLAKAQSSYEKEKANGR